PHLSKLRPEIALGLPWSVTGSEVSLLVIYHLIFKQKTPNVYAFCNFFPLTFMSVVPWYVILCLCHILTQSMHKVCPQFIQYHRIQWPSVICSPHNRLASALWGWLPSRSSSWKQLSSQGERSLVHL
ncbi:mCG144759, partial [Mus musculus]